ncbi:MAG: hypothetical protein K9G63_17240 [Melioribacteraceae bacterium]|nr:hypothetical protein [Melioribacteraceae bacterium]
MSNEKEKLFLFEAIELRDQFDRLIKLLESILNEDKHHNPNKFIGNEFIAIGRS